MKKVILSVFALTTLALVSCKNDAPKAGEEVEVVATTEDATVLNADVTTSVINWVGSKVGGEHKGTLNLKSGEVAVKDGALQGGSFVLDLNTITVTDLEGDYKAKLEGHLKGAEGESADHFFNVAQFPEGKFVIASVETVDGKTTVTGNLTLKDITKSVSFPATVTVSDAEVKIESSEFVINRTDFNINYGSKTKFTDLAADNVISDDIKLQLTVVAKK